MTLLHYKCYLYLFSDVYFTLFTEMPLFSMDIFDSCQNIFDLIYCYASYFQSRYSNHFSNKILAFWNLFIFMYKRLPPLWIQKQFLEICGMEGISGCAYE